jgi:hypothetical protein
MTKIERGKLDEFSVEMKNLKKASELREKADEALRYLTPILAQLDANLKSRQKMLTYPEELRKMRPIFKNYEDDITVTNNILIQMEKAISEYIERDSEHKKTMQELYEKFDRGEYQTD